MKAIALSFEVFLVEEQASGNALTSLQGKVQRFLQEHVSKPLTFCQQAVHYMGGDQFKRLLMPTNSHSSTFDGVSNQGYQKNSWCKLAFLNSIAVKIGPWTIILLHRKFGAWLFHPRSIFSVFIIDIRHVLSCKCKVG